MSSPNDNDNNANASATAATTTAPPDESKNTPTKTEASPPARNEGHKTLNVNARSFVPKMEANVLQEANSGTAVAASATPNRSTGGAASATAGGMSPSGMPAGIPPMPPAMMMPGMPFLPGMTPFMPGMPMMVPPGVPPGLAAPGKMPPGMPPSPSVIPPVAGGNRPPMAPGFVATPMAAAAATPSASAAASAAPTPTAGSGSSGTTTGGAIPQVSVGNATLAAKRSHVPPKFACVLLAGITGVGKSTAGRQLVQELSEDKLGWHFFSGADYLKEAPTAKPATWDVTKSVFDGLNETLDSLLARQASKPIRGLLIDKQLRGVEDLYYLTQLLRSKGLLLWGIIGLEVVSDEVLLSRLGNTPGQLEKIKYHRVVYNRIVESAKQVGIWRTVDASGTKADSLRMLRTMVLGCSSQSPTKQFTGQLYHDNVIPLVDNYQNYSAVMSSLFSIIPRNNKGVAIFPGFTTYTALSSQLLDVKKLSLKEYAVRRKVDGTKYVLFFDGAKLYLIPRHMRCVFEMNPDAWLGVHLSNTGKFVVDGDLVKTTKDRSKEKFVVSDIVFWADKGSVTNLVARATWKERQERLKTNLCSESSAFFPKKGDLVVVHEVVHEETRGIALLLNETCDYPCDGLVFHSMSMKRDDPTYLWRPPEALTADFRLGAVTIDEEGTKIFALEVFDQKQAKYVQYRSDTTEVPPGRGSTCVEGAYVSCSLDTSTASPSPGAHTWALSRVRTDIQIASFKAQVDELLKDCIIPKQQLLDYVTAVEAKNPHAAPMTKQPQLGGEKQPAAPSGGSAPAAPTATTKASRQAFGSALSGPDGAPPEGTQPAAQPTLRDIVAGDHKRSAAATATPPVATAAPTTGSSSSGGVRSGSANADELVTDAQKLSFIVGNVRVKAVETQSDVQALQSIVGSVSVVSSDAAKKEQQQKDAEGGEKKKRERVCNDCSKTGHGRIDRRDNKFYCYECWAKSGVEFCEECKDFASGHREGATRRRRGAFYCDECWKKYDKKEEKDNAEGAADSGKKKTSSKKGGEKKSSDEDQQQEKKEGSEKRAPKSKSPSPEPSSSTPVETGASAPAVAKTEEPEQIATAVTA